MQNNNPCKFIQIWKVYPTIASYLTQIDKIKLCATNSVIRQLTSNSAFWPNLQMTGNFNDNNDMFRQHLKWISKYLRKYKPRSLSMSIYDVGDNSASLVNIFMEGIVDSVEKLDIYCEDQEVHLACSLCFSNLQQLTIRSKCVNNQLVQFMTENMTKLNSLIVIKNDLEFTCKKLSKYMPNPMQKLIMKPYAIDFQQILKITQISAMTLEQLQIDVEQCSQKTIIKIVQPLRKLQKLRLYHLQYLDDDTHLWQVMKNQSKVRELALTKAYNFHLNRILMSITSSNLISLDITDSRYVNDDDIIFLSKGCPNLKQVNVSWCNSLSCEGLKCLIQNCLKLEVLNITGVKDSRDVIFGEYNKLLAIFDEECYTKAKNQVMNDPDLQKDDEFYDFDRFFAGQISKINLKTLRNLRILDCQSCNGISDNILKIIYILNPRARTFNYYGNYMGLFPNDNQSTFC